MSASKHKNITCRQWKLNPDGCSKESWNCEYAHHDTGSISPPSPVICATWATGSCYRHQDRCLFSHLDAANVEQLTFSFRRELISFYEEFMCPSIMPGALTTSGNECRTCPNDAYQCNSRSCFRRRVQCYKHTRSHDGGGCSSRCGSSNDVSGLL